MHVNVINLCISQGSSEKQQRYRYIEIYIISLPSTNWRSRKARGGGGGGPVIQSEFKGLRTRGANGVI